MAADLAQHFHSELHLLKVIPIFPTISLPDMIPEADFIQHAREYAEHHLAKCQAVLAAQGIKASACQLLPLKGERAPGAFRWSSRVDLPDRPWVRMLRANRNFKNISESARSSCMTRTISSLPLSSAAHTFTAIAVGKCRPTNAASDAFRLCTSQP